MAHDVVSIWEGGKDAIPWERNVRRRLMGSPPGPTRGIVTAGDGEALPGTVETFDQGVQWPSRTTDLLLTTPGRVPLRVGYERCVQRPRATS